MQASFRSNEGVPILESMKSSVAMYKTVQNIEYTAREGEGRKEGLGKHVPNPIVMPAVPLLTFWREDIWCVP